MQRLPTTAPISRFQKTAAGGKVSVTFTRPEVFQLYYKNRHCIDDSNNLRQNAHGLEASWLTKDWPLRSFAFFIALCEANAFNAFRFFNPLTAKDVNHMDFRRIIIAHLLQQPMESRTTGQIVHDLAHYNKDDKLTKDGKLTKRSENEKLVGVPQYRCAMCKNPKKTSHYCVCDHSIPLCTEHWAQHVKETCSKR